MAWAHKQPIQSSVTSVTASFQLQFKNILVTDFTVTDIFQLWLIFSCPLLTNFYFSLFCKKWSSKMWKSRVTKHRKNSKLVAENV